LLVEPKKSQVVYHDDARPVTSKVTHEDVVGIISDLMYEDRVSRGYAEHLRRVQ
jgi:hypothetical protein